MASISLEEIKRLRELTGVGITEAKRALVENSGDFDKALAAMRKKGLTKAEKRSEREARSGLIGGYVHDGRIGVLLEVNCETDFVAKTDEFKDLVKDISLHVAASAPVYINDQDIPSEDRKQMEKEFSEKVKSEGKPDNMVPQIVEGMVKKYFAEKCLLSQPFIKNPEINVGGYIKEHIAKLGENILVRRFTRIVLGEVT
ncbi:elongation factor Ts [Candidatus Saccharibacteria bacterium]|nr:elongation factor Ts [Candidatus Saccharibacteria bacterium]